MDFSLGALPYSGIIKAIDFKIAYILIAAGMIIGIYLNKKGSEKKLVSRQLENKWTKVICLLIIISITIYQLINSKLYLVSSIFTIIAIIKLIKTKYINYEDKFIEILSFFIIFTAINTKILVNTSSLLTIIIINLSFILLLKFRGIHVTYVLLACFIIKNIPSANEAMEDLFHGAEYFVTHLQDKFGYTTFSNIGYLEEWLPNVFADIIASISNGKINLSLIEVRYITSFILSFGIFVLLAKKNLIFSILVYLFLPLDRISLLFVIFYGLTLLNTVRGKEWYAIICVLPIPILLINLSPSYALILLIPLSWAFFTSISKKKWILILLLWCLQIIIFWNQFYEFFKIYISFSKVNVIAHGTPLFQEINENNYFPKFSDLKTYIYRIVFLIMVGIYFSEFYKFYKNQKGITKYGIFITCLISIYLYVEYALTRVDQFGFSRIIPIGIGLIIICGYLTNYFNEKYTAILFVCLYLMSSNIIQLNNKQLIDFKSLHISSPYIKLEPKDENILEIIKKYSNNSKMILFSNSPGLVARSNLFILPPFTTPWVSVGNYSQYKNIKFFSENRFPIFLGTSFNTNDDIDIRARSPLIFKYLSNNYNLEKFEGLLFAVPNKNLSNTKESLLFSGFHIGKTPKYLQLSKSNIDSEIINIDCTNKISSYKVKVISEKNYFFTHLGCGANKIPKVLLDGKFEKIEIN